MDEKKVEIKENIQTQAPAQPQSEASEPAKSVRDFGNTFSELQAIQNNVKRFKFGDIVVPVLSILTLALLTIFVYIPMITSAGKFRSETKEIEGKIDQLDNLKDELKSIDAGTLQTDLTDSRTVIPFSLQVSDFVSYIDLAAKDKGLVFKEILAGDIVVRSTVGTKEIDPVMRGVSGPLKYSGTITQITEFLSDVQQASPFILAADQIKLKQEGNTDKWELSVNITGYYMNQAALPKTDIYMKFTKYTQNQDILKIFKSKADKLK